MDRQQIIMNFTVPPSNEDIKVIAEETLDILPEELLEYCESLLIEVEEFPDEAIEDELDLDDSYDLLALYRNGNEISPGIEKKGNDENSTLIIYRRPLLDYWCESQDSLNDVIRNTMIEELADNFDFTDDEIEDMTSRHYQGLL